MNSDCPICWCPIIWEPASRSSCWKSARLKLHFMVFKTQTDMIDAYVEGWHLCLTWRADAEDRHLELTTRADIKGWQRGITKTDNEVWQPWLTTKADSDGWQRRLTTRVDNERWQRWLTTKSDNVLELPRSRLRELRYNNLTSLTKELMRDC